jgi:hypothetical protein
MNYRTVLGLVLIPLVVGCGGSPSPTPDLVATPIAVEEAAHATMTARAPTATEIPPATETLAPTASYTSTPVPADRVPYTRSHSYADPRAHGHAHRYACTYMNTEPRTHSHSQAQAHSEANRKTCAGG